MLDVPAYGFKQEPANNKIMSRTSDEMCRCLCEVPRLKRGLIPPERARRMTVHMKLLSHPTRLQIITLLSGQDLCVCALSECIGKTQPNVSQHLCKLKEGMMIESYSVGKLIFYRISDPEVIILLKSI
jgi:DNA-binding transcriptional ArsR family regulator